MAVTSGTLIDGARMYAAAADAVNERHPNALHVLSHLLGMAIELALKAFLMKAGQTERELRKIGHDLQALLAAANAHGLTSTGSGFELACWVRTTRTASLRIRQKVSLISFCRVD